MRPGFIWGPQHAEIAGMGRRVGRVYLMYGPFTRLPLSHVENCADCLVAAVERQTAIGETFNVIDDDDVRVWRYVRAFKQHSGSRGILLGSYSVGLGMAKIAAIAAECCLAKREITALLTPRRFEAQFKPIRFSNQKLKESHVDTSVEFRSMPSPTYDHISSVCGSIVARRPNMKEIAYLLHRSPRITDTLSWVRACIRWDGY
jgi:hypothetical protein